MSQMMVSDGENAWISLSNKEYAKVPAAPAVLSGESGILSAYQVGAYPTFVLIGRDGKVAGHLIGFGGEAALRAMLEKAGLTSAPKPIELEDRTL